MNRIKNIFRGKSKIDSEFQALAKFRQEVQALIDSKEIKKDDEVLPPWIACIFPVDFPGADGHIYWTSGDGGCYWGKFLEFWMPLSQNEKKDYFLKYDLGEAWKERQHWFIELFNEDLATSLPDEDELFSSVFSLKNNFGK